MEEEKQRMEILLVEDSPDDAFFSKEAFSKSKLMNTMQVATDGVEAMKYLRKEDEYKDAKKPDLILLDLNLPKKSGIEVLKEIREDTALTDIPVIVLTTSSDDDDIRKSYQNHANCFITKPVDIYEFLKLAEEIEKFWFGVARLPKRRDN